MLLRKARSFSEENVLVRLGIFFKRVEIFFAKTCQLIFSISSFFNECVFDYWSVYIPRLIIC